MNMYRTIYIVKYFAETGRRKGDYGVDNICVSEIQVKERLGKQK